MEQKYQDIIKANYTTLVRKIQTSSVTRHLFASNIITEEMKQQIEAEKSSIEGNRKLISIILRRGPDAFRGFRTALMKANQADLSKLLIASDNTVSEYEQKLSLARSLILNTTEKRNFEKPKNTFLERQKSQEERCRFSLDDFNDLFLAAVPFKDEINIHIRHFTVSNGRFFPTKKGVTFSLQRWLKFESLLQDIEHHLKDNGDSKEMKWHIGGGVYVSLNPGYPTVDIRHFWKPNDAVEPVPTRKGVTLNNQKLTRLLQVVEQVRECVPELNQTELCGMLSCPECSPFGYEPKEDVSDGGDVSDLSE